MFKRTAATTLGLGLIAVGGAFGLSTAQSDDQDNDGRTGSEAFGVFARAERAGDRPRHAATADDARRVGEGQYLIRRGGQLCVVTTATAQTPGGEACSVESTADREPPVAMTVAADGSARVAGAASDRFYKAELVQVDGTVTTVSIDDNAFEARLPKRISGFRLVATDGHRVSFGG
ncbi:hypothetical protein [Conexibacter sp. SYSU D00693]|uniref:hypothetical protein n=1 Tax=Conexibacter sp. SYSU D00693 TaxID=2812560 RepID=UPI00196BA2C0|nr:hypothetical protein [Conexibacter sp. SYSU D00693]